MDARRFNLLELAPQEDVAEKDIMKMVPTKSLSLQKIWKQQNKLSKTVKKLSLAAIVKFIAIKF